MNNNVNPGKPVPAGFLCRRLHRVATLTLAIAVGILSAVSGKHAICAESAGVPNIILIMADDMGFSDIGCYGGEIETPNIDKLAAGGLRFTQFYNTARCCPTRACLMSGLYPHQAGVGHMMGDRGLDGTFDATVLAGDSPEAYNSVEKPDRVVPQKAQLTFQGSVTQLPPHSLTIIQVH